MKACRALAQRFDAKILAARTDEAAPSEFSQSTRFDVADDEVNAIAVVNILNFGSAYRPALERYKGGTPYTYGDYGSAYRTMIGGVEAMLKKGPIDAQRMRLYQVDDALVDFNLSPKPSLSDAPALIAAKEKAEKAARAAAGVPEEGPGNDDDGGSDTPPPAAELEEGAAKGKVVDGRFVAEQGVAKRKVAQTMDAGAAIVAEAHAEGTAALKPLAADIADTLQRAGRKLVELDHASLGAFVGHHAGTDTRGDHRGDAAALVEALIREFPFAYRDEVEVHAEAHVDCFSGRLLSADDPSVKIVVYKKAQLLAR